MKTICLLLIALLLTPLAFPQSGYSQVSVSGYELQGYKRIDRTHSEFTYTVLLTNHGGDIDRMIGGRVKSLDPNIQVQFPGATTWDPIPAGATEESVLPITLIIDHTKNVNFHALVWTFGR